MLVEKSVLHKLICYFLPQKLHCISKISGIFLTLGCHNQFFGTTTLNHNLYWVDGNIKRIWEEGESIETCFILDHVFGMNFWYHFCFSENKTSQPKLAQTYEHHHQLTWEWKMHSVHLCGAQAWSFYKSTWRLGAR